MNKKSLRQSQSSNVDLCTKLKSGGTTAILPNHMASNSSSLDSQRDLQAAGSAHCGMSRMSKIYAKRWRER